MSGEHADRRLLVLSVLCILIAPRESTIQTDATNKINHAIRPFYGIYDDLKNECRARVPEEAVNVIA